MSDVSKQALAEFMAAHSFCTIATVSVGGKPESAYVGYTNKDNFEVIVGTSNKSRKYQNLLQNKSVALVVADMTGEVQYEGEVEIIEKPDYEGLAAEGFTKLEGFTKYRDDPNEVILKIKPTWIRFIIHGPQGSGVDQIVEFTEFA